MPESKSRKPKRPPPHKAVPRKRVVPLDVPEDAPPRKPSRDPAREIPEADRYVMGELPPPASYEQVLVALSEMDPLTQEVMIAQRLAAMPSQRDGSQPVNIPRMVRGPWAHQLRKLGIFCIPELATHELVAPDGTGMMLHHTASSLRRLGRDDLWEIARQQNPEMAKLVDEAKTPEEKERAMKLLAAKFPVEIRMAMDKLMQHTPADLEPK